MSGYNPDLYLNDTARRDELARAEEILKKYRSRSTGVTSTTTTTTTTNVQLEKPIGQKFHENIVRSELEDNRHFTPVEKNTEYRSEFVRNAPQEDVIRSKKVITETEVNREHILPTTDSHFTPAKDEYHSNVQKLSTPSREYVEDDSRRSKSLTSPPKKAGFMAKIKSLFRKGDKTHHEHIENATTTSTNQRTFDESSDVIYALVKVQRWDERSGLARGFTDEGYYTTLKMNRSSLYDRGLTKDHSILSWLRRDKVYLDDIIDSPTRHHVKQMLGLSPHDNIRLEVVEDPTSLLNTTEMQPIGTNTSWGPETSFRERIYPDNQLYYPYSTWETRGPVQFSGKPKNILGLGDFKGEGMIQGTNVVSRIMRGATEGIEHAVTGRRDFEERDHTILGRRDIDYPVRPDQYYNRNDEVFRGDDYLKRDRIPRGDEYAERDVGVHREGDYVEEPHKKGGFGQMIRDTKEGIKATLHGNKEPEFEEGMKPSAGQQIKDAFKGAVLAAKAHKGESGLEHDVVHDTNRVERIEEHRTHESTVNRTSDRELYEEKKPGLVKRTVEGMKTTMHGTNEPDYVEGTKPSAGQQIKDAFKGAVLAAKDKPHDTIDNEVVRDKAYVEDRNISSTSGAVVTEKPSIVEKIKSKITGHSKTYDSDNVGAFDEGIRANQLPYRQEVGYNKPTVGEKIKGDIYNEPVVTEYDPVVRKNDLADKGFHSGHKEEIYEKHDYTNQEKVHISSNKRPGERFYDKGHPNYNDEPVRYQ